MKKYIIIICLIILSLNSPSYAAENLITINQQNQIQKILEGIIPEKWNISIFLKEKYPFGRTKVDDVSGITFLLSFDELLYNDPILKEWQNKSCGGYRNYIPSIYLTFMPPAYNGKEDPESFDKYGPIVASASECLGNWNNLIIYCHRGYGYEIDDEIFTPLWSMARSKILKAFELEAKDIE